MLSCVRRIYAYCQWNYILQAEQDRIKENLQREALGREQSDRKGKTRDGDNDEKRFVTCI